MPHLQAIKHAIGDVWKERLDTVISQNLKSEEAEKWDQRSLHQLLIGTASYNRDSWGESDIFTELRREMSESGIGSVLEKVLPGSISKGSPSFTDVKWILKTKLEPWNVDEHPNFQEMIALFRHWVPCPNVDDGNREDYPCMYKCAMRATVHYPERNGASFAPGKFDQIQ